MILRREGGQSEKDVNLEQVVLDRNLVGHVFANFLLDLLLLQLGGYDGWVPPFLLDPLSGPLC